MKVCAISANLGSYDPPHSWVEQSLPPGVELEIHRLTDENFPPRHKAMTSRLQCGIPKMFGWQMFPGADVYLWVDASCALLHRFSVTRFLGWLGNAEIAVFKHPDRKTIKAEYGFCKQRLAEGNKYLSSRYEDEFWDEQYAQVTNEKWYTDDTLYASTAFIYRPTVRVRAAMTLWWAHKSRYLLHDQLAMPLVLKQADCDVKVIEDDYRKCDYLTYVRNKKKRPYTDPITAPQTMMEELRARP